MQLELDLQLLRDRVPLGGAIAMRTTIRNRSDASIELASLFDNNRITNYVVLDEEQRELARVNHVTRQLLMEKVEPRTEDERRIQLAPGAAEVREDNLCRYHWFERPGRYLLRARYVWNGYDVWSDPVALEIVPAPIESWDHQWGHHYGEKFLLHSSWVLQREHGVYELFFRESLRFRPQVINANPVVLARDRAFSPRVSFNRSLIAGTAVWLAWLEDDRLELLKTNGGLPTAGPLAHAVPLRDATWVTAPLTSNSEDLIAFVSGLDDGSVRRIMALRFAPDGSEQQRTFIDVPLGGAVQIHGVCDRGGGCLHLLWLTAEPNEVVHVPVDLATLKAGSPTRLWRAPGLLVGLLLPPVVDADAFLCAVHTDARFETLSLAWLQLDPANNPIKVQALGLPGEPDDPPEARAISHCTGEMNLRGHPFALVTTPRGLLYVNGALMQSRRLAGPGEILPPIEPCLVVNDRNDVFFVSSRAPHGLSEILVHTGIDAEHGELG